MRRNITVKPISYCALFLMWYPFNARAGGPEYSADGTRGLGRGGASMTRADDPRIMVRNPALLANLWGSMAYMNFELAFPNACFQPSGGWGWGDVDREIILNQPNNPGEGIYFNQSREGSVGGTDPDNLVPLENYKYDPYPKICNRSSPIISPSVGLTTKLGEKLGIGIGFMPPELASAVQYGNPDGTIDTPDGKRPNPARYLDSNRSVTYFGLLGALGYRILPWLRVGAGLRWSMVLVDVKTWFKYATPDLSPANDVLIEYYGQDLFIPGFTVSVHAVPIDELDIAVGFHWEDKVRMNSAKVDMLVDPFGLGSPFYYKENPDAEVADVYGVTVPYMNENVPGSIAAPPPTPPQLSFGIRYADRIKPRPEKYTGLQSSRDPVRDSMTDERWDIEFNAIIYFNSVSDNTNFFFDKDQRVTRIRMQEDGVLETPMSGPPAKCTDPNPDGSCSVPYVVPITLAGQDHVSLRLGGDINIIPGVFAVRAGGSYEGRGVDPDYIRPTSTLPFERFGLHTGLTWRVDGRTDLTFAFAHFWQETLKIAVNGDKGGDMDHFFDLAENRGPAQGMSAKEINEFYNVVDPDEADGVAMQNTGYNDYYLNAGTHTFNLFAVGVSVARHF